MGDPVVHFEILGTDGAKLQDFYRRLFNWQIDVMPEFGYGMTRAGGDKGIGGGVGTAEKSLVTVYIEVDDIQGKLDEVVKAGATIEMPVTEMPGVVTFAQFVDPAGNVVGLVSSRAPGQG